MCKNEKQFASVLCEDCKRDTKHKILFSVKTFSEYHDISGYNTYQVVQCQGCDTVSFRVVSYCSEDIDYETGKWRESETLYPERTKKTVDVGQRQYDNLPDEIDKLYRETIGCFKNDFEVLAAVGARALIEGICQNKGGKERNLKDKIAELEKEGILTKDNATILQTLRHLGNEAAHEFITPSRHELSLSIRIIEHVLDDIYEFPAKKEALTKIRSKAGKKT